MAQKPGRKVGNLDGQGISKGMIYGEDIGIEPREQGESEQQRGKERSRKENGGEAEPVTAEELETRERMIRLW